MAELPNRDIQLPLSKRKSQPYLLALKYCLINVFGSFLSILVAWFIISSNSDGWAGIQQVIKNGEAIIICISLVISAIYTLSENLKLRLDMIQFFFWLSIISLIVAIVIYVPCAQKQAFPNPSESVRQKEKWSSIIWWSSTVLFTITLASVYYSQVISYNKENPNLNQRNSEFNTLRGNFESLNS